MGRSGEDGKSFSLHWTIERQHNLVTVHVGGELDLASADALETVIVALFDSDPVIVADLAELGFMDSTGIRLFGRLHQAAEANGKRFLLAQASPPVRRILQVAGLVDFFDYVEGSPPEEKVCRSCDSWVPSSLTQCTHCGAAL